MHRFVALITTLALLPACAADDPHEPLTRRFTPRPIAIVASPGLPAECVESLTESMLWYRERGATFTLDIGEGWESVLNGVPVTGQVGVLWGELGHTRDGDRVDGETVVALSLLGDITGAEITLASCEPLTVAHELGHALGLVHTGPGNLMARATEDCTWELDSDQLAWIMD